VPPREQIERLRLAAARAADQVTDRELRGGHAECMTAYPGPALAHGLHQLPEITIIARSFRVSP
jgi:hypothetical protein